MVNYIQILNLLPQTQCRRCGYADCEDYAKAIATNQAPINQCSPGGSQGIARLAKLTNFPEPRLNPDFGTEQPRAVIWIDEDWCIGCTRCIKACPVDAIIGSNKVMHTVQEEMCTGCELCLEECPVDCMNLEVVTEQRTGWDAWSPSLANQAKQRYQQHKQRMQRGDLTTVASKKKSLADLLQARRQK